MTYPDFFDRDHVVNPEAIGNPDEQPIVQLSAETADWLMSTPGYCRECGGLNYFHSAGCAAGGAE